MKWSKSPKRIFDGGSVGRDTIDVFRSQSRDDRLSVFTFRDAAHPDSVEGPHQPEAPTDTAPPLAEQAPPPGIAPADVARRETAAFEAGKQAGLQSADEHVARLTEQLEGAVDFFHRAIDRIDVQASRQAVELALIVAEQLFRRSVELEPNRLLAVVDELRQATGDNGALRIIVDPATAERWRVHDAGLRSLLGDRPFEVEAQSDLSAGDVIVHCGELTLDDRISNRVHQYARAIEQALGASSGD